MSSLTKVLKVASVALIKNRALFSIHQRPIRTFFWHFKGINQSRAEKLMKMMEEQKQYRDQEYEDWKLQQNQPQQQQQPKKEPQQQQPEQQQPEQQQPEQQQPEQPQQPQQLHELQQQPSDNQELNAEANEADPKFIIDGYNVRLLHTVVKMDKISPTERVRIKFNIGNCMPNRLKESIEKLQCHIRMRSAPDFEVKIIRGDWILSIRCRYRASVFLHDMTIIKPEQKKKLDQVFDIKDVAIYVNPRDELTYTLDEFMIDKNLYDVIIKTLADVGVTNDMALQISHLATAHFEGAYDDFLRNLQNFGIVLPESMVDKDNTN